MFELLKIFNMEMDVEKLYYRKANIDLYFPVRNIQHAKAEFFSANLFVQVAENGK